MPVHRFGYFLTAFLCFYVTASHAQIFTTFSEWPVPTAAAGPRDLVPAGSGVYFTELNASKIAFLNMTTNLTTEWPLPAGSYPHGLGVEGQNVIFAEGTGKIAILDTTARTLTQWNIPRITAAVPEPLQVSVLGPLIFFSDAGQGAIGMLDTSTNLMTQWLLPGAPVGRTPNGIFAATNQNVWVADYTAQKITLLSTATNTLTEWTIPNAAIEHLDVLNGVVAFEESNLDQIGMLTPAANILREWAVPTPSAEPLYVAGLSAGVLAFSEYAVGKIATLNVAIGPFVETTIAPVQMAVAPRVQTTVPTSIVLAPVVTATIPTAAAVNRGVAGGFTEYQLPMLLSRPAGVAVVNGAILFAEFSSAANRIGRLY